MMISKHYNLDFQTKILIVIIFQGDQGMDGMKGSTGGGGIKVSNTTILYHIQTQHGYSSRKLKAFYQYHFYQIENSLIK